MATLKQFSRRMSQIGARIEHNTEVMGRRVVLAVHQAVVLGTPVDEGIAQHDPRQEILGKIRISISRTICHI